MSSRIPLKKRTKKLGLVQTWRLRPYTLRLEEETEPEEDQRVAVVPPETSGNERK